MTGLGHEVCFQFQCSRPIFHKLNGVVYKHLQSYIELSNFPFLQLHNYISQLTRSVISKGLIDGLFLTGLTADGIKLLTNYVNQVS